MDILKNGTTDESVKANTTWVLGMIGQHSSEHWKSVYDCGAVTTILEVRLKYNASYTIW